MANLSISNIAWSQENDEKYYELMREMGFSGLEIAPTRIFPEDPYARCNDAKVWSERLFSEYGLKIPSMQSIWYGRQEHIFGPKHERDILVEYTKDAIRFAESIGCNNLVFGCPKNRNLPEGITEDEAVGFFRTIGDYAFEHGTAIGMEANPAIYNTNYINTTESALHLIEAVDSKGFLLNLDIGTMVENEEDLSVLAGKSHLINHVHISEPWLKSIVKRELHKKLKGFLEENEYSKYISIEMGKPEDIETIEASMEYIKRVFDNE